MKALFDHNLPPCLARCIQGLLGSGHEIIALRDKFPCNITDIDLIEHLSVEGGWVFISGDRRITRNKTEKAVFRNSNIIGIFLSRSVYKADIFVKAQRLIALWRVIEAMAASVQGGAMFELPIKSVKLSQLK